MAQLFCVNCILLKTNLLKLFSYLLIFLCFSYSFSQTTDLAVSVEAQNLSGTDVSQVHIYEEFQYLITISNSGDAVNNATFTQIINEFVAVISFESQNASGGASDVVDFDLNDDNELSGTISTLPNSSSVEVKVIVRAPISLGGIATNVVVEPPIGTTDTNTSNDQAIISIDVTDIDIDFSASIQQISPSESTPINAWGEHVTYQFTISNNSIIDYPLNSFRLIGSGLPLGGGVPNVQVQSLTCLSSTGGAECPGNIPVSPLIIPLGSNSSVYLFSQDQIFPSNSSITFELIYKYLEPDCIENPDVITAENYVQLEIKHDNISPNVSNTVNTILLEAPECLLTDVAIETTVINPSGTGITSWDEDVILETIVTNYGPLDVNIRFFLQNLSAFAIHWNIASVTCLSTTGGITCNDITYSLNGDTWNSNDFTIPAGSTITTQTILRYVEDCTPVSQTYNSQTRSAINILSSEILDSDYTNNFDDDYIQLLPTIACPTSDLVVTKTQIFPELPIGETNLNPMPWEEVTYEINVMNIGTADTFMTLLDEYIFVALNSTGIMQSLECIDASGGASCGTITTENIGVEINLDTESTFWEITEDDAWEMPAGASVTFQTTFSWLPLCDNEPIEVTNRVSIEAVIGAIDTNTSNDSDRVSTFFTPCVDLVVQTFPSSTTVPINANFDWIVDITNSNTSSNAVNIEFIDDVNPVYTISGTPTCEITNGNATCISTFNINGNNINGIIPNMEAGSTIRIRIPVTAPNFGGAFNNIAEAIPSIINNEETTPETNISISNAQILAPPLTKTFNPNEIYEGQLSTLTFTINNINTNPEQNNISFTDNLPTNIVLAGIPDWFESNGCTATFVGDIGDDFVGVTDLSFPSGVESCTFSVLVTSNIAGNYLNNDSNFSNQSNIDSSQASATLNVLEDTSDVDIEILKSVNLEVASINDHVEFTITATNLGTTLASNIVISDVLPDGYLFISSTVSYGSYTDGLWNMDELQPNQSEELIITAKVLISGNYLNIAMLDNIAEQDRDNTNNEDSAEVEIDNCLDVSEGMSPNDDGFNDTLLIPCIENYPNNSIKIFNRLGVLIFEQDNYNNNWNGKANRGTPKNSEILPVGVYFYILKLDSIQTKNGWFYLNY